jgi:predicted transcriptional regulator
MLKTLEEMLKDGPIVAVSDDRNYFVTSNNTHLTLWVCLKDKYDSVLTQKHSDTPINSKTLGELTELGEKFLDKYKRRNAK